MSIPIPSDRMEENPCNVQRAELVVGMPSLQEPSAVLSTTLRVDEALRRFFPDRNCVIVCCDASSSSRGREDFSRVPTETPKISLSTPEGVPGKGRDLLHLFARASELGARGIVVVDANLERMSDKWIRNLAEPLFSGYDFVSPVYSAHPCQWTVSNNIVYPLTRCLYGKRVREPMGGDFAVSAGLAGVLLNEPPETIPAGPGINTWITTQAIISGRPLCQSFLEGPPSLDAGSPLDDALEAFLDNCRVLFNLLERCHGLWKDVRWSKPTPVFGLDEEESPGSEEIQICPETYREEFGKGFVRFDKAWRQILHQDLYLKIWEIKDLSLETFEFPHLLWALILYDFAVAHRSGTVDPETCLASLIPLYLGRISSYAREMARMTPREVEVYVEDQCRIFEETKPHLKRLW